MGYLSNNTKHSLCTTKEPTSVLRAAHTNGISYYIESRFVEPLCPNGAPTRGCAAIDLARNQKLDRSFFGRAGNCNLPEVCWNTRSTGDTRTWNTCSRSVGLLPSTAEMFEMQEAPSCSKSTQDGGCDRRSSISAGANRVTLQTRLIPGIVQYDRQDQRRAE